MPGPVAKTDLYRAEALAAIKEHNLVYFSEIATHVSCGRDTLYKNRLHEDEEIRALLRRNRVLVKQALRVKWFRGTSPLTQIALYRLLATDEELARLDTRRIKVEAKIEGQLNGMTLEEKLAKVDELKEKLKTINIDEYQKS